MNAMGRFFGIMLVLVAMAFAGSCHTTPKKKKEPAKKEAKAKPTPKMEESEDADFDAFVSRLRKAVAARDLSTIAGMMTPDFGYALNPERSGDGVFKYWDENNIWPELNGILSEKFVKKYNPDKSYYMVAPPQFADSSLNYNGYRVGIVQVRGSWKFAYFVNG